jgi:Bifunctional DNA primase/polymerase, N-terminal/Primase C terminal 1 (PriCT-1)
MTPSAYDWAMAYADAGFVLLPLVASSKIPARAWRQYQDRRPERSELGTWWPDVEHVPYGFGLVCGHLSGVTVIDADGDIASTVLLSVVGTDDRVPLVKTKHGWHAYFAWNGERNRTAFQGFSDGSQLDRRGEGGYVVIPPTPGKSWKRHARREDWTTVPAGWARSAAEDRPPAPVRTPVEGPPPAWSRVITAGKRHDTFLRVAGAMVGRGASPSEIEQELLDLNSMCSPPFTPRELEVEVSGIVAYVVAWS